jgi:2,3-dihydroxybenzoate decarboxylase
VVSARLNDLRDGRIEEMDAAGIDIAVLSHTIGGVEGIPDAAVAVNTARRVNDFLAAEIAGSGGRFAGFATIALQDVDAAVKVLSRAVTELGFCCVIVNGYSNLGPDNLYLDEDRFELFWTALEELRVPLYLHPRLPSRAVQEAMYRGHPDCGHNMGIRARDSDSCAAHRLQRGVPPAPGSEADHRPSRRDAPLIRLAHPACL